MMPIHVKNYAMLVNNHMETLYHVLGIKYVKRTIAYLDCLPTCSHTYNVGHDIVTNKILPNALSSYFFSGS